MSSVINIHLDTIKSRDRLKEELNDRFKTFCSEWFLCEPNMTIHFESMELAPNITQDNQILNLGGRLELMRRWLLQHIIADRLSESFAQPEWLANWLDQALFSFWNNLTKNQIEADRLRISTPSAQSKLNSIVLLTFTSEFGDFHLNILRDDIEWVEVAPVYTQNKSISLFQALAKEQFKCICKLPTVEVPLSLLFGLSEGDVVLFDHPATESKVELHVNGQSIAECKFSDTHEATLHVIHIKNQ